VPLASVVVVTSDPSGATVLVGLAAACGFCWSVAFAAFRAQPAASAASIVIINSETLIFTLSLLLTG
jgi:hypothetical protein